MFFGKNKTSLKLIKQHPELLSGCEYLILESSTNPKIINVGSGISKLYLRSPDGEEYLLEGNFNKIKDMFVPSKAYENMEGKLFKVIRPIASLMQNQMLKEIAPCQYDEKIQLGNGITEQYFIQKTTNKILKIYGNSNQIKNLFEEVVLSKPKPVVTQAPIQQTKVEIIEKVIVKETTPVVGAQGLQGEKGVKGDRGDRGEMGPRGPEGKQGEIGPRGEIGPVGPKGERGIEGPKGNKGDKGDKGDRGEIGPQGVQGVQGIQGPQGERGIQGTPGIDGKDGTQGQIGPQGEIGPQGIQGEKGEKGDRGPVGPQGPVGPRGEAGEIGPQGLPGKDGISPILNAEFPLAYKDGNLSFDSTHITKILDKFKNSDIQKAIDKFAVVSSTPGGGGLGALWNTTRIQKNISDINFTGAGVSVYQVGKGIRVDIPGGGSPPGGLYVTSISAGAGITVDQATGDVTISATGSSGGISSVNGLTAGATGNVNVKSLINGASVLSLGATGSVLLPNGAKLGNFYNAGGIDLVAPTGAGAYAGLASNDLNQFVSAGDTEVQIGTDTNGFGYTWVFDKNGALSLPVNGYIKFPNGTTQGTAPSKFFYTSTSPSGVTQGDRWMDSDNGIEYVYINDGNSQQWVQPTNTGGSSTTSISILATTTVTGSTYATLPSDYYIGVSYAGQVTVTLPVAPETGREIVVKDESGNAGNGVNRQITIVGATASHTIDNQSSAIINLDNAGLHFIYRNGWRII